MLGSILFTTAACACRKVPGAVLLTLVAFGLTGITLPKRGHHHSPVTACKSNLKNLGTALEMYATHNGRRYPAGLDRLVPNYLRTLPTCPSAGSDTYSHDFRSAARPDVYTFYCAGDHHGPTFPRDYPQYNNVEGLVARPEDRSH
ncbi:MAG: hypothetical protein HY319_16670 [Armatimonadetes bacterium]|nr:hypothetical protein [Armatimonadota bacterium]